MLPSSFFQSRVLRNRTILAVDDDPNILSTIGIMMRSAGIRSVLIESAEEAIARLPEISPDLILLDYMMPRMNGAEFYDRFLNDPKLADCRRIPVVMLSAKTDNFEEQEDLLRKGMSAYLLKPFGFNELINIISNVLTLQEARNENERLTGELRDAKNYLQTLFNSIDDCISVQDASFRLQSYNQSALRLFNGGSDEKAGDASVGFTADPFCYRLYFGQSAVCSFCKASEVIRSGRPQFTETPHPGNDRHMQIGFFPLKDPQGRVTSFIETIRDVTEKKKMESQLIESSRLAAMGSLAMGVAHEINNPLCIILGFAQSLLKSAAEDDPSFEGLKIIEEECQRCAGIVQDLLAYARPSPSHKRPSDIAEIMQSSLALMRHHLQKKNISVTETYEAAVPPISADPKKIQQVLINLLLNAVDSIGDKGAIDIRLEAPDDDGPVRLTIADNGCGIDETLLPRIFDPFISTKFSHGSGLGLSICRSIILEHGGTIEIQSKKNAGTKVTLFLPTGETQRGSDTGR